MPDIHFHMPDDQFFAMMAKMLAGPTSVPGQSMAGKSKPPAGSKLSPAASPMLANSGAGKEVVPPSSPAVAGRKAVAPPVVPTPKAGGKGIGNIKKPVVPDAPLPVAQHDLGEDEDLGNGGTPSEAPESNCNRSTLEAEEQMGADQEAVEEIEVEAEGADVDDPTVKPEMGESVDDLSDSDDQEPPEEAQPDPRRRPLPPGAPPIQGKLKVKGGRDYIEIRPVNGGGRKSKASHGGDRIYRCKPTGKCYDITPDDGPEPEPPPTTRRRPRKPRR